MNTLAAWVLGSLLFISPPEKTALIVKGESAEAMKARYEATATQLAEVIQERGSLFKGENGEYKTAALMVSIMKFESNLTKDVATGKLRGDHNKSWCYMQINVSGPHVIWGDEEMRSWTGQDLVDDWKKCFAVAHDILKYSLKACASLKEGDILSGYTAGKCYENEPKARHRWNYAQWLLRRLPVPTAPVASN